MSYENIPVNYGEEGKAVNPATPLATMMDKANVMVDDILAMVGRIDVHMFGKATPNPAETEMNIECFRDALDWQIRSLNKTAQILTMIIENLGV